MVVSMSAHDNPQAQAFIAEKRAEAERGPYWCGLSGERYDTLPKPMCEACPLWDGTCDVELRASLLGYVFTSESCT